MQGREHWGPSHRNALAHDNDCHHDDDNHAPLRLHETWKCHQGRMPFGWSSNASWQIAGSREDDHHDYIFNDRLHQVLQSAASSMPDHERIVRAENDR